MISKDVKEKTLVRGVCYECIHDLVLESHATKKFKSKLESQLSELLKQNKIV